MNIGQLPYSEFHIIKEMWDTIRVVRTFDHEANRRVAQIIENKKAYLLTGEGSSRLFPAKRLIASALTRGKTNIFTEASLQSLSYPLEGCAVLCSSNSGQTSETIQLLEKLAKDGHDARLGVTAHDNTPLTKITHHNYILTCGGEKAVAATKSVVEQALYYDSLFRHLWGESMDGLEELAKNIEQVLSLQIPDDIVNIIQNAKQVYFAGNNTGVAEELKLKTNEIIRKPSDYLEGTYALHGIEEVLTDQEVIVWIEPFEQEFSKIEKYLAKGVGIPIIVISSRPTPFPTIVIPEQKGYDEYLQLVAGWNVLIEAGIRLGQNLDKPVRARKVGNLHNDTTV